jgi:hypothetical protein
MPDRRFVSLFPAGSESISEEAHEFCQKADGHQNEDDGIADARISNTDSVVFSIMP